MSGFRLPSCPFFLLSTILSPRSSRLGAFFLQEKKRKKFQFFFLLLIATTKIAALPALPDDLPASVYCPSEDSFLFVDVIDRLASDFLPSFFRPGLPVVSVEIGGGSGVLSACWLVRCAQQQLPLGFHIIVDINPEACITCQAAMRLNGFSSRCDVVQGNLADSFASLRSSGPFEFLIFNPPYVPTDDAELEEADLTAAAWAGGRAGRRVLDQLLSQLDKLMAKRSVVLILAVEENRPQEICNILSSMNFECEIVGRKKARNERLCVIRGKRG